MCRAAASSNFGRGKEATIILPRMTNIQTYKIYSSSRSWLWINFLFRAMQGKNIVRNVIAPLLAIYVYNFVREVWPVNDTISHRQGNTPFAHAHAHKPHLFIHLPTLPPPLSLSTHETPFYTRGEYLVVRLPPSFVLLSFPLLYSLHFDFPIHHGIPKNLLHTTTLLSYSILSYPILS